MEIFPAIDLKGGKVVRLFQGDYNQMTVYSDDPLKIVKEFIAKGATHLHIVDLDGAKDGTIENFDVIRKIVAQGDLFVEVGGGIRNEERIKSYLDIGVNRVILGTVAVKNFSFVEEMTKKYGNAIAVGVDAKDGMVAINGWCDVTDVSSVAFCKKCRDAGVSTIIYTDISKDGALEGTNLEIYNELNKIENLDIVASGGVTFLEEIKILAKNKTYAAIVGKAIYVGKLELADCIKYAEEE